MLYLSSCSQPHYFEAKIKVPNQTWNYDSIVHFGVPINDSSKFYRLWLVIKHEESYPYANLWLKVITKCPCGAIKVDTVNIWFLDQHQRFIGTGIGKTWTVIWPFQDSVKFPTNGIMDVYIQHIMRKNNITGIKEIGLIVDKLK